MAYFANVSFNWHLPFHIQTGLRGLSFVGGGRKPYLMRNWKPPATQILRGCGYSKAAWYEINSVWAAACMDDESVLGRPSVSDEARVRRVVVRPMSLLLG